MIIDHLDNAGRYTSTHKDLLTGFGFLQRPDLSDLADGEYEIDGGAVFAIIARGKGRGKENSLLEFHRRYLDIQYIIAGPDLIGWRHTADCSRVSTPYDHDRDVGFFYDRPETWIYVPAGSFALFHPEDAHAPFATTDYIHKVVVKLLLP